MNKLTKLKNRGFSAVEGLLVVVLALMVAGVGYYVYNQSQKQDETSKPQSSAQAPVKDAEACQTKDGLNGQLVRAHMGIFGICMLNGWNVRNYTETSQVEAGSAFTYVADKPVKISELQSPGSDGLSDKLSVYSSSDDKVVETESDTQKTEFVLNDGTKGMRYYTEYGKPAGEGIGPKEGDKAYHYTFKSKGGDYFMARYTITKGTEDHVETVEKSLKTLEFYQ